MTDLNKARRLKALDAQTRVLFERRPDLAGPYTEDDIQAILEKNMPRKPTGRPRGRPQKPHGRLTVRVPQELLDQIEGAATAEGINVPELVRQSLVQYLADHRTTTRLSPAERAARLERQPVDTMSIQDLIFLAERHKVRLVPEEGIKDLRRKLSEVIASA